MQKYSLYISIKNKQKYLKNLILYFKYVKQNKS